MKKCLIALFALVLFANFANAKSYNKGYNKGRKTYRASTLNLTDPFFMANKGRFYLDAGLDFINVSPAKSFGINAQGHYAITDRAEVALAWGWQRDIYPGDNYNGLQDFTLSGKYRFFDGAYEDFYLDVEAYLSPSIFSSIADGDGHGTAKGAFGIGFAGIIGTTKWVENFTFAGRVSFDHVGKPKYGSRTNALGFEGIAKYYLNDVSSFEGDLLLRFYDASENYIGYGICLGYAYEIIPTISSIMPYWGVEKHNKDFSSAISYGVKFRIKF